MVLKDLLADVRVIKLYSATYGKQVLTQDLSVQNIRYDSRKVGPSDMFVAMRGTAVNGHRFIQDAMKAGAVVVVMDDDGALPDTMFMHEGIIKVVVPDSRLALAQLAANYYGRPAEKLTLCGVTGTNGKTTTANLVASVLEARGDKVGLLGTIEYRMGGTTRPATHTTPESLELNSMLADMVHAGCTAAVMEVSSHALALHRVAGLRFQAAVFTNLTQDHLDYHKTMEEYFRAKKILFDDLGTDAVTVLNADDPYAQRMKEGIKARVLTYGTKAGVDVRATEIALGVRGCSCIVTNRGEKRTVRSPLTGHFNIENILGAYAAGIGLGIPVDTIVEGIQKVRAVRGRFEQIPSPAGWTAIIDYAHTPDALEQCLNAIHDVVPPGDGHRVITVFGCGGDRDRGKRHIMGRIASEKSNVTVVTSDNPRTENPATIMEEVLTGVLKGREVIAQVDRHEAIRTALSLARKGDVVLIAGKGHENYQVVGTTKHHFDDREEVMNFIREKG